MKKIVLTGGGTAGHIYPALAVAERLSGHEIHFIGSSGMEKDIISKEKNITFHQIRSTKLARSLTPKNLLIPFKLYGAIKDAKKVLSEIKPNVIFSKGGYVSLPTVIAAESLSIPVISHESDLSMGLANKIIYRYCTIMCTAFSDTCKGKKCKFTGQPIRRKVMKGDKSKIEMLGKFSYSKPNLLVIGGSLGARFINEKVWEHLDRLTSKYNVVHITGKQAKKTYNKDGYKQIDYAENIGDYLAWADLVLSRAGSGAINEFVALRIPALLIPLSKKASRGDQIENAKLFTKKGFCDMLEEEEFEENLFFAKLERINQNRENLIENMKKEQKSDACDEIIALIKKYEAL